MKNGPLSSVPLGELINAYFVLKSCSNPLLVKYSTRIVEAFFSGPFKSIAVPVVRRTFFRHFCAGESIEDVEKTLNQLEKTKNFGILDYAAENISTDLDENYFKNNASRINSTVLLASRHTGAMVAIKLSSLMPYSVLKSTSTRLNENNYGTQWLKDETLKSECKSFYMNMQNIANLAKSVQVPLLIDAENIEVQPAIDFLTMNLMHENNSDGKPIVCNTYQMYLTNALQRLQKHLKLSQQFGFTFGLKLVRGAYLKSDKNMSGGFLYGPIFNNVEETHSQYNKAIDYLMRTNPDNLQKIIVATHNDMSVDIALKLMSEKENLKKKVIFAQLLGMGTDIAFKVKNSGFQNSKYLPYGPVELTIPYLSRRAEENGAILRNKTELRAILEELKDRIRL